MRLIDAELLLEQIAESREKNPHKDAKIRANHTIEHDHIAHLVLEQPTAYDVDKVVERLETLRQNEIKLLCEHESDTKDMQAIRGHNVLQDAIKIVKSGGIE